MSEGEQPEIVVDQVDEDAFMRRRRAMRERAREEE